MHIIKVIYRNLYESICLNGITLTWGPTAPSLRHHNPEITDENETLKKIYKNNKVTTTTLISFLPTRCMHMKLGEEQNVHAKTE